MWVVKRNGALQAFDQNRISEALKKAKLDDASVEKLTRLIVEDICKDYKDNYSHIDIEDIQARVLKKLKSSGFEDTYRKYRMYMEYREKERKNGEALIDEVSSIFNATNETMKENANINTEAPMGAMLKAGSASVETFTKLKYLTEEENRLHTNGDIHIHDLNFYPLTTTCCQIPLDKLFEGGFSTGRGTIREPKHIDTYASLCAIVIQANQNNQHGGQSIPCFDYYLAPGVKKTLISIFSSKVVEYLFILNNDKISIKLDPIIEASSNRYTLTEKLKDIVSSTFDVDNPDFDKLAEDSKDLFLLETFILRNYYELFWNIAIEETEKETFQAMEGFLYNMNTMNSRCGSQVPFSSINYGTDTSFCGRMVIEQMLLALEKGLGNGETPVFPIHVFKVKKGVNYGDLESPNMDLFKLACRVASKRLFPNFCFLDASYNIKHYLPNHPESEVCTMGCRTRIMDNIYDPSRQTAVGRGNLSFTSINLVSIAIRSHGDLDAFFNELEKLLEICSKQLFSRYQVVSKLKVKNMPFLMSGVWIDSEKLSEEDTLEEVLKHGSLSIGFIGLAEALVALTGKHHGESEESDKLGYKIVKFMSDFCAKKAKETKFNYSLIATPAEGLSGRFTKLDKERYGIIKGVTDRNYYTNSFHVPVYYNISIPKKLQIEGKYHALCLGGHISYVELGGSIHKNPEAVEDIVNIMFKENIGYGSINYPVDYDPVCGYNGVIDDKCPKCGRDTSKCTKIERVRRITGYLVEGGARRFNPAKMSELLDRVQHDNYLLPLKECTDSSEKSVRLAGIYPATTADGEGLRLSIYFQGCTRNCKGCHNKKTHDVNGGVNVALSELEYQIKDNEPNITGVTISGGEPFLQIKELYSIVKFISEETKLSILIYTGFTIDELKAKENVLIDEILRYTDYLIDGEFKENQKSYDLKFRGSTNQRIIKC